MKKKFLTNLLLLIFLNLLIKPFWIFGIDRTVQNITGTDEYGFYFSLLNFSLLFNIILDVGITNFNNRNVSRDSALFYEYFPNIVAIKFILSFLYAILSISFALLFGYDDRQISLLIFLIVSQFISSFLLFFRSNISALQFYTTDSILSVLDRTIMIILCSLVIWGHIFNRPFRIEYFVYIQLISYSITALIVFLVLKQKAGKMMLRLNVRSTFRMIRQLIPYALLGFLMAFYNRMDSIMLERLLPGGKTDAGTYAQSFRILDAASNFTVLFATLLLPMFSRQIGNKENILPLLRIAFLIVFITSIAFSFSCFSYGQSLMAALYHHANQYSVSVFSLLIFSFVPISLSYVFGTLLTANGNLKQLNYIAFIAVVLNLTLNLLLIPSYKAVGSAVASLITQTFVTIAQLVLFFRIWNVRFVLTGSLRFILFLALSAGASLLITCMHIPWIAGIAGTGLVICTLAFVAGLLPVKSIVRSVRFEVRSMKD